MSTCSLKHHVFIVNRVTIEANEVSSAFAYSSYSSEAFPTRCVHEEISAIPVLCTEIVIFWDINKVEMSTIYIMWNMINMGGGAHQLEVELALLQ